MSLLNLLKTVRVVAAQPVLRRASCTNFFSSKTPRQGIIKEIDPESGALKTKKTNIIPKITLVSGDAVTMTTLQEAEKLSKRRDLKLVKVVDIDAKTQRPVYKLMTGSEYHAEDFKQREKRKLDRKKLEIKGEKVLLINSRIAIHDLDVQLKKALKWIHKKYEIRVVITSAMGNPDAAEKVYAAIETFFKCEESDAKILQKRSTGSDIKFQISPPIYKDSNNKSQL